MERDLLLLRLAALSLLFSAFAINPAGSQGVGVNYGMKGDNLPPPKEVISLYKSKNITKLRLFNPDATALSALKNSGVAAILGTLNEDLQSLAADPAAADSWVRTNVLPYASDVKFRYIDVGNEVIPGESAQYVLPAMRNLATSLRSAGLSIPVTTAVSTAVLGTSYPPSQGAFSESATKVMGPIVSYLASSGSPLLVNVYPYFAYADNPQEIQLDYALFGANGTVVQDGELGYTNMFDAMVDSMSCAMELVGGSSVGVVVSETGWPSAGGDVGATVDNARTYNANLVKHVSLKSGTPKFPGREMEVYMFAMFNENLKPQGTERNFGMFYPDMSEVYHLDF